MVSVITRANKTLRVWRAHFYTIRFSFTIENQYNIHKFPD